MSEAAAGPVGELRSRLRAAEQASAELRQRSEEAANALVHSPTREAMQQRDGLRSELELRALQLDVLRQQLREAEVEQHRVALQELAQEHVPAVAEVQEIWAAIEGATGALEESCARGAGLRREASRRTLRAREHHAAAGLPEEERPAHMIALPRSAGIRGRLEKVAEQLRKLEVPNW